MFYCIGTLDPLGIGLLPRFLGFRGFGFWGLGFGGLGFRGLGFRSLGFRDRAILRLYWGFLGAMLGFWEILRKRLFRA